MLTRAMVVRRRRAQCGEVYDQYPLEAAASGDAMKRSAHTPSSTPAHWTHLCTQLKSQHSCHRVRRSFP